MLQKLKTIIGPYGSRLSWNSNNWIFPSGCLGKCYGSGASASNFECSHGFGFEEWLFNAEFQCADDDGELYQYGFIQCFHNNKSRQNHLFREFLLWTRICQGCCDKSNNGEFYYVGTIKNLEVLDFNFNYDHLQCLKNPIYFIVSHKDYKITNELKAKLLKVKYPSVSDNRFFNVRFKVSENKIFYPELESLSDLVVKNIINSNHLPGYRFRCYKLENSQVQNITI